MRVSVSIRGAFKVVQKHWCLHENGKHRKLTRLNYNTPIPFKTGSCCNFKVPVWPSPASSFLSSHFSLTRAEIKDVSHYIELSGWILRTGASCLRNLNAWENTRHTVGVQDFFFHSEWTESKVPIDLLQI